MAVPPFVGAAGPPAPAALPPLEGTTESENPYESGALFHGPAFRTEKRNLVLWALARKGAVSGQQGDVLRCQRPVRPDLGHRVAIRENA